MNGQRSTVPGDLSRLPPPEDFINAIRTVHERESLLFPAAVRRLATRHGGPGGRGLAEANLTDREAPGTAYRP
jgi:DNA-binding NarL/FixJ family response regulator